MKTYEEIKAECDKQLETYRKMYSDFYDQQDKAFAARLEERRQHQEKKMALAANAMGMLSVVMNIDNDVIGETLKRTYAWMDYCGSLPYQMFNDSGAGQRIKKNFNTLYNLYLDEAITQPFTHWLDDTNPSWMDVPETWPTNSTDGKA